MRNIGVNELSEIINVHSKSAVIERNGWKVVISEKGARILGIFLNDLPNLLWVNPRIEEVLERGEWNVGGHRIWISPERNFFYKDPENFDGWFCPEELDPGSYKIVEDEEDKVILDGEISVYDNVLKTSLEASVRREIRLVEAGRKELKLRIREGIVGKYSARVHPWVLTQVPISYGGVGTVLVSVKRNAEPIHYFGEIPKNRLRILRDHVAFKIDGNFVSKLGVRPEDLREAGSGAIAYVSKVEKRTWSAIILRTHNLPLTQEDCLDIPKWNPDSLRGVIQSYNSGPEAFSDIKFGEIELQLAPTINLSDRIFTTVEYDLIGFIGQRKEVLTRVRRTMKIKKPRIYAKS